MRKDGRVARVVRFVSMWILYGSLVAAFLMYLNNSGFWVNQLSVAKRIASIGSPEKSDSKELQRIPDLWERPTTVTFKITERTTIEICNGGTQRYDQNGNLWHEEDPPLRVLAGASELAASAVVVVIIDNYYDLNAKNIYIERLVGFHEGEEPRPEYTLGGPGWANNITFSGWIVSSSPTEVTVRYP